MDERAQQASDPVPQQQLKISIGKTGFQAPFREADKVAYASCFRNWRVVGSKVQVWSYTATQWGMFEGMVDVEVDRNAIQLTFVQWGESVSAEYAAPFVKFFMPAYTPLFQVLLVICRKHGEFEAKRKRPYWRISKDVARDFWRELLTVAGLDLSQAYLGIRAAIEDKHSEDGMAREALERPLLVPDGLTLFSHQEVGIRFLLGRTACLMADDMGLGKTVQVIVGAINAGFVSVIIFSPSSVVYNWRDEIKKWAGVEAKVLGSFDEVKEPGWYITSIDTAKRKGPLQDSILKMDWQLQVIDEAHKCKNTKTQRWKVANKVKRENTWLLTGTPIMSRPIDLYGLLKLTSHHLGRDKHKFGVRFCDAKRSVFGPGWDYKGATNIEELALELDSWMIRRTKDEVLDLPPKFRTTKTIKHSRKIAVGYTRADMMAARARLARAKAPQTLEVVSSYLEANESVIVFSEYLDAIETLVAGFKELGFESSVITGATSKKGRHEEVQKFQAGVTKAFVGQTLAAGEGITLTEANYVFFNDLSLVPSYHAQAEDRAYRIGQKSSVWCTYMLSTHSLDKVLWEMLEEKIDTISNFEAGISKAITPEQLLQKVNRYG